ncbi:glutathione S-transferase family protein [Mariluticola halotolerans]|uniref:glutathione S-transferase family protein n=1 Tax=Mariluticola halotolerans TaxID=2909283 RepID=UPI0026E28499|nr:glutathione S-transferase family protein [Mariluticola halotolerans]UJQ95238.1 glutathione S-transferase family protein [Mariluticola halotolerans]
MRLLIGNKNYSTWSMRPWLVLKHFAIPFSEEFAPLSGEKWQENLQDRSPSGKVPVLFDGDLVVTETIAIIEYIADIHPHKPVWPADIASRALARAASAEMHAGFTALRNAAPMNLRASHPGRIDYAEIKTDLRRLEVLWGELLARSAGPYLFGSFSAADAMFAPVAARIRTYDLPVSTLTKNYVEAIYDLPAFKEWHEEALKESWIVEQDEIDYIQGKTK